MPKCGTAVRRRDLVVERLAQAYPGLRPVCFYSPYEAACWAVIGHRIRITAAAGVKERIAATYGERCTVDGVEMHAFPDPDTLRDVACELPVPQVKQDRLRGIAAAALAGELDAAKLRALAPAEALAQLQRLDGIGPYFAELILIRGVRLTCSRATSAGYATRSRSSTRCLTPRTADWRSSPLPGRRTAAGWLC